jgi:hypothetical protein
MDQKNAALSYSRYRPANSMEKLRTTYKETDAGRLVVLSNLEPTTPYYKYRALFLHPSVVFSFIHRHVQYGSFL